MTMNVAEFVLARIAEDEAAARDATNDGHRWLVEEETIGLWPDDLEPAAGFMHFPRKAHAYHAATWNPARVLAECEAKRRIVELHRAGREGYSDRLDYCSSCAVGDVWDGYIRNYFPCDTLRALAAVYADHEDFQEEWRP